MIMALLAECGVAARPNSTTMASTTSGLRRLRSGSSAELSSYQFQSWPLKRKFPNGHQGRCFPPGGLRAADATKWQRTGVCGNAHLPESYPVAPRLRVQHACHTNTITCEARYHARDPAIISEPGPAISSESDRSHPTATISRRKCLNPHGGAALPKKCSRFRKDQACRNAQRLKVTNEAAATQRGTETNSDTTIEDQPGLNLSGLGTTSG